MLNRHTKISTKIISLILAHVFLVTGLACPEDGKLRSPMGFREDGELSRRAEEVRDAAAVSTVVNTRIIPQADGEWKFTDLRAASYIENLTIDNLISKAKEYHQINSREAKLLAGDFAIQALNKIVVEKASINVSEL
ncbi:MAG: hypothetical protein Q8O13_10980, partial [Candidatus Omnitrophota bacterium]|nr:hypothetical protein [Candidatus Omnitrophota bacterium]